jgi:hypothetical protein
VVVDADAISLVCDAPSIVRWEPQESSFIAVPILCCENFCCHNSNGIVRGAQSVCITPNKAEMNRLARALLPVEQQQQPQQQQQQQQQQRADTSAFDLVRRVAAALDGPVVVQKVTATAPPAQLFLMPAMSYKLHITRQLRPDEMKSNRNRVYTLPGSAGRKRQRRGCYLLQDALCRCGNRGNIEADGGAGGIA